MSAPEFFGPIALPLLTLASWVSISATLHTALRWPIIPSLLFPPMAVCTATWLLS
jgi:hypothetical protein